MPHVSSSGGGDDLGSTDEVKVFKDEGEDEKRSSENLTEEKSSLIDLTESEEKSGSLSGQGYASTKNASRSDHSPVFGEYRTPVSYYIYVFSPGHVCCEGARGGRVRVRRAAGNQMAAGRRHSGGWGRKARVLLEIIRDKQ
ncbi:hypothetical protein PR048_018440 [Dryococelus australis]|uniref:CTNNB1 binding N-teminal domain-containing protein n=1 Tax=Dryococelus australis TaxID=614101 RepID=A0ABQ9HCB2_9NEOP|nr:hypothetical protein PR048_018440 [Dryococelus australis]